MAHVSALETALHTANLWVKEIMDQVGSSDKHVAYVGLRAALHALRDRLPVEQAAALGAQLPLLVRGIFYEGWHPHGKPLKERKKEEFLAHVQREIANPEIDIEALTRAVFQVLAKHVSPGEVKHVKIALPREIQSLWSTDMQTGWF